MSAIRVSLYGWLYCWGQAKCPFYEIARYPHFRGLFVCKSMEMVFPTKQSIHIIVDVHILRVSAMRGSTVHIPYQETFEGENVHGSVRVIISRRKLSCNAKNSIIGVWWLRGTLRVWVHILDSVPRILQDRIPGSMADTYILISEFCNNTLRSLWLIVSADSGLWFQTDWNWNPELWTAQYRNNELMNIIIMGGA